MALLSPRRFIRRALILASVMLLQLKKSQTPTLAICAATRVDESKSYMYGIADGSSAKAPQIPTAQEKDERRSGVYSSIRYLCDPKRLACVLPAIVVSNIAFDPQSGVMHFYSWDTQFNITHVSYILVQVCLKYRFDCSSQLFFI